MLSIFASTSAGEAREGRASAPPAASIHRRLHDTARASRRRVRRVRNRGRHRSLLSAQKDGKVRLTCASWKDAKVLPVGEMIGLRREGTYWVAFRIEAKGG